ncbi:hypothetical protein Droror1_Dr00024085 [Drosera rotundifolia]
MTRRSRKVLDLIEDEPDYRVAFVARRSLECLSGFRDVLLGVLRWADCCLLGILTLGLRLLSICLDSTSISPYSLFLLLAACVSVFLLGPSDSHHNKEREGHDELRRNEMSNN